MLKDLAELIAIESVMDTPAQNAPFGQNLRAALDWFLDKAKSYGLKTGELDGYCGFAEYGEDDKPLIGILGHLDVVPSGEGWHYPPFRLTLYDGVLYGRGVVDNKGPIIVALHILKELKERNAKLNNRIRLIVGCNEENGSLCMQHYVKHGEQPKMSIVPDADFPLINSEKGILHILQSVPLDSYLKENFVSILSGDRPNVVPDHAVACIKKGSPLHKKMLELLGQETQLNKLVFVREIEQKLTAEGHKTDGIFIEESDEKIVIKTKGIAGHAMAPKLALNAIYKLLSFLTALIAPKNGESTPSIFELFSKVSPTQDLQIECSDEKSGELTMNLGIIKYDEKAHNNSIDLTLDIRLPISAKKDDILSKIKAKFPKNSEQKIEYYSPNLYLDESLPLIKTLLSVYSEVTKKPALPKQTGGGTYAKTLKNSVAFGPTFPDMITNIHNADEAISVNDFYRLHTIYSKAVLELDKL